ncbi:hypothetical protein [Streptomyces sp. NPDC006134]|uniref:hypothetical protein n=1 Tax=Streptomyces sp. NPDC006134 TaxID=3154467 RepID=UPI003402A7CD
MSPLQEPTGRQKTRRRRTIYASTFVAAAVTATTLLGASPASADQPWDGLQGWGGDEFSGSTLDPARWDTKRDCCGEINGGFQEKGPSPAGPNPNRSVSGGYLRLSSDYGGATPTGAYVEERSGRAADGDTTDMRCFPASAGGCAWAMRWKADPAAAGTWQGAYVYGRDDVTELNTHEVDPSLAPDGSAVQATHIWGDTSKEPSPNWQIVPINRGDWNISGIRIAADGTVTRYMNGTARAGGKVDPQQGYHLSIGTVPHGPGSTAATQLVDWVREYRGR